MILSTSHKFIFVHIPKTAGLAVTDALGAFRRDYRRTLLSSAKRRFNFRESPETVHFRVHEPAKKMIRKLGREVFDSFTTFSVIRNPFDHAVSHYEYMKQFRIKSTASKVGGMTFEEYLVYRKRTPFWNDTIFARMPDQMYYLEDAMGNIAVDRLVRFERLTDDLNQLAEDLKLEGVHLRHVNKTKAPKRGGLETYYTPATTDLVLEIYDRDFENLGYSRELPVAAA